MSAKLTRTRAELRAARLAAMRAALLRDIETRCTAIADIAAWPLPSEPSQRP